MEQKTISIVIPAYNEAQRIGKLLKEIRASVSNIKEVIVVFDGNDSTPEVVETIYPDAKILQYTRKLGKGMAVVKGIESATGDMVAFIDADGSISGSELERLKEFQKNDNFVIASRWLETSRVVGKQPLYRIFLGRIFHYFVFFIFRIPLKDTQCGLKIFNTRNAKSIIQKVQVYDWAFDVSMIYHGMEEGLTPKEIGITWLNESNSKLKVFTTVPRMFFSVVLMWIVNKHDRSFKMKNLIKLLKSKFEGL